MWEQHTETIDRNAKGCSNVLLFCTLKWCLAAPLVTSVTGSICQQEPWAMALLPPVAHSHVVLPRTGIIRECDFKLFRLQIIVYGDAPCQGMASCVDVSSTAVHSLGDGDAGYSVVVLDCRISWLGAGEIDAFGNTGLACLLVAYVHLEICSRVLIRTLKGPLREVAAVCAALADLALIYSGLGSSRKGI